MLGRWICILKTTYTKSCEKRKSFEKLSSLSRLVVTVESSSDGITSEVTGDESLDDGGVVVIENALMLAPFESSLSLSMLLPHSPSTADGDGNSVQTCILENAPPRSSSLLSGPISRLQHNNHPRNGPHQCALKAS